MSEFVGRLEIQDLIIDGTDLALLHGVRIEVPVVPHHPVAIRAATADEARA